ncbi:hypothetical protein JHK87_006813 [Glycine soja]|nr:hypothetical protein JHK87_006813 [Glycine soja]
MLVNDCWNNSHDDCVLQALRRNKKISAGALGRATAVWVLFELLEYHLLTLEFGGCNIYRSFEDMRSTLWNDNYDDNVWYLFTHLYTIDRYHLDKNANNPEASELFKEVAYSYSVLSDPEKRRQYDSVGFEGYQTFFPSPVAKADLIRYQSHCLKPSPCQESTKSQNEWFDYNKFVNVDFSIERHMLIDDQKTLNSRELVSWNSLISTYA